MLGYLRYFIRSRWLQIICARIWIMIWLILHGLRYCVRVDKLMVDGRLRIIRIAAGRGNLLNSSWETVKVFFEETEQQHG